MNQSPITLAAPDVRQRTAPNGSMVLQATAELGPYADNIGTWLRRWAAERPDTVFLAERRGDGWRELTYRRALAQASAVGQALLDRGLGPGRPVMILSGNSVDHGVLSLACQLTGVPVVPVSPAYCLMTADYGKVVDICAEVTPGLVYAERGAAFAGALDALSDPYLEVAVGTEPPPGVPVTMFDDLLATRPSDEVDGAGGTVGPDTVAKILYTSGSTGVPKGVINTHRMLCANQQQLRQIWPFLDEHPPILLDWLPWNHTFGGNHDFNLVLANGGSLYIDDGRPSPDMIDRTVRNLRHVHPTIAFNVPAGYGALLPLLEADDELAMAFFDRLQMIFYAAAALPQDLWQRLERLAGRFSERGVVMTSSWGSTETAPLATSAHFPLERAGNIGVPVPGVELKLVPADASFEVRVRGPNVTPGYFNRPERTAQAFDEDGFYRIGDAVRLADPDDPSSGLLFDGRVAEDFKLLTGTKVPAGQLRVEVVAALSPFVSDAVVCGHDRADVGLLVWLHAAQTARALGLDGDDPDVVAKAPAVREALRERLDAYNAGRRGSSTTVRRVLVMTEPPSFDAGEITDKGYINQRATLQRRAALVERLYDDDPGGDIIALDV